MKEDGLSKHPKRENFCRICEDKFWKKFNLCNECKSESVMIRFLRNLTKTKLGSKNDAEICFLSECIHTLETKDKSQFQTAFSLLLHGLTRSKKLVNVASDLGVAVLFHNVLYLHEFWAREGFERQPCAQQK